MSTIQKINFEVKSDVIPVVRRAFTLADKTLIDPNNALVLLDGEWMAVNDSGKLVRAADIATVGAKALNGSNPTRSYPLWGERGRTDVQAIGKAAVLFGGWFEAETRLYDASAKATGGAEVQYPAITYVGQPLQVACITIGTRNVVGLVGAAAPAHTGEIPTVVGYVSALPSANGNKLKFVQGY